MSVPRALIWLWVPGRCDGMLRWSGEQRLGSAHGLN